ncbi:hypothetical protein TSOC_008379 [Tetrabaena socialis]|uniref:DUF4386 domain-containing protein n=1 Tax=Tetrabaena socialis TaxID=47790 RepID=A0A2J7ZYN8_9CHLO|nr:hypothetical protein TSOC_008379 [Tetrabaena socialis]|eukprot:PNH05382.1 hypothetical protein TSOC_008379 [Tetrabaena socialis]
MAEHSTSPAVADAHPRRTARWIGILFLVPFLAYGFGDARMGALRAEPDFLATLPARAPQLTIAALLLLTNSVVVVVLAVLLHPLLARWQPRVALAYTCTRLAEGLLLAGGTLALLLLLPIAQAHAKAAGTPEAGLYPALAALAVKANFLAFQLAMLVLGLGSLPLCLLFLRSRLLPGWMALWGLGGYALLLAGSLVELFGLPWGVALAIPGGLWELTLGVWLIVRGFAPVARSGRAD